ncbi:hemolymph lipopolysaccharide-binding protein [Anabrus simplex]|uniref:hemolymph lipopolysaccharide-binding protein n=1 Tax=Anabrus simplex TaxID=316456 RepID=UPI0035A385F7
MYLVVLVLLSLLKAGQGSCLPPNNTTGFSLGVSSSRNSSGFWITKMEVINEKKLGVLSNKRRVADLEFNLAQDVTLCSDSERIKISAQVISKGLVPPPGYEVVNGLGYYKLHTSAATWETARATCEEEGAHLIIVNTDREAKVVQEMLARFSPSVKGDADTYSHVGIHIRYSDKIFRTLSGEPVSSCCYNIWAPGNPKGHADTLCACMHRQGQYHDTLCSGTKYYFICEFP